MKEQNENLMLRKQIDSLYTSHKAQNRVTGEKLKSFSIDLTSQLSKLREELARTKKEYTDGSLEAMRQMDGLKDKLIEVNRESQEKSRDIAEKIAENVTLTEHTWLN